MNSHCHIKFVLSWERFLLPLLLHVHSLKCWLKCAPLNVEETYKKNIFALTENGTEIGFLTSEGYSYSYPRNTDYISPAYPIPEGWYMNIYFQDFDVEESKHCL